MLRIFNYVVYVIFPVFFACGCSYTKDLAVLNKKQAIADIDYLVKNLEAVHPEPYHSIGKEAFSTHVQQIKANLGNKISRKEFAPLIAETLALIGDDHTRCNLFYNYNFFIRDKIKLLPLALNYKNNHVIVEGWAKTVEPVRLQYGDIVLSINGKPVTEWLKRYYKYVSAETMEQKNWQIPYFLPAYIWMTDGIVEQFEITGKNVQGQTYQESLSAAVPEFSVPPRNAGWGEFPYQFYYEDRVCHYKIPSFDDSLRDNYFKMVDTLLVQLKGKKTTVLIVDLRQNGGGNGELGQDLLQRVVSKPLQTGCKKWRYSRTYERNWIIAALKQKNIPPWLLLDRWLRVHWFYGKYHHLYVDMSKLEGEWINYCIEKGSLTYPKDDPWNGMLVLIVDHGTASAAVDTTAIVKDNGLGLIVGEETGGRASFYSEICPVYLPNSGIGCVISSAHFIRPAGYDDGHGVLPDVPMDVTLEDDVLVQEIYHLIDQHFPCGYNGQSERKLE